MFLFIVYRVYIHFDPTRDAAVGPVNALVRPRMVTAGEVPSWVTGGPPMRPETAVAIVSGPYAYSE